MTTTESTYGITYGRIKWPYGHSTHGPAHPWVHKVADLTIDWKSHTGWQTPHFTAGWACGRTTVLPQLDPAIPEGAALCPDCFDLREVRVSGRSVVYYAEGANGAIKIGTSIDATRRVGQLPVHLLAVEAGDRLLEGRRHHQFEDLRMSGEWFYPGPALLAHVASLREAAS